MKTVGSILTLAFLSFLTSPAWAQVAPASDSAGSGSAFSKALTVSWQSLIVIFVVMAAFGGLVAILTRVFPETEEE